MKTETSTDGGTSEVHVKKEETLELKIYNHGDDLDNPPDGFSIKVEDPENKDYLSITYKQVDRSADIRRMEGRVKNKFKWSWLEEKDANGDFLSDYLWKVDRPGYALCTWCNDLLKYESSGKKVLLSHSKCKKHIEARRLKRTNQTLPTVFHNVDAMEKGATSTTCTMPSENVHSAASCSASQMTPAKPVISFLDRKSYQEAALSSFMAEHSLPLSMSPHLIKFAQEFSRDTSVTNSMCMDRTTASYKLREGLGTVLHKRLVSDLQKYPFSMNVDECTSSNNQKVLSILVNYYSDEAGECVTKHYNSTSLVSVNAKNLHKCIDDYIVRDDIPRKNIISMLCDSANYTRGKVSGLETLLRKDIPHLLDIDGDTCRHIQNSVRIFCKQFGQHAEHLIDDLHADFKYSTDLLSYLKDLCVIVGNPFHKPPQRIAHLWLSAYDTAKTDLEMMDAFTTMYFAWLPAEMKSTYKVYVNSIISDLSAEMKNKVNGMQQLCQQKALTDDGRKRKQRIVEKIFYQREWTLGLLNMYVSVLPMFKSFVLIFEQNEPMCHRLHDKQTSLFRDFLACFIKQEHLTNASARRLKELDVCNSQLHHSSNMYVGSTVDEMLQKSDKHSNLSKKFLQRMKDAYMTAAGYMQKKLPLNNALLKCLSAIDPKAQGHSLTAEHLKKLKDFFPTILSQEEKDQYLREVSRIQMDPTLPAVNDSTRLDHWWREVMPCYPALGKVVRACLSIFTGPKMEQSFSFMNDLIGAKSNRMAVQTYAAIQAVKYDLKARRTNSLDYYNREDILRDPVDKSVCYHMQTAHGRYAKKLREMKEEKALPNPASQPKTRQSVHSIAKNIKKDIWGKRKRKQNSCKAVEQPKKKRV
ncbi:uncharacterized protein LOC132894118 isoform X2 [Neoarius graeffei]|uniref:uncharacterized protein LOC132894118 isoform X2 n=1 Tax=Neoarius graeffei TaxID=443677 RepID=UPI00298C5B82|nr:uncharacterized protein LOC132894118 isoform X2 [Neoarius graeffei]